MNVFQLTFTVLLPLALVVLMFGLGLGLEVNDFRRVLGAPRAILAGMVGQLLLLPLLAFALAWTLPLPPEIAIGMIIISACPGGLVSNVLVALARADVALSITLTAINSVLSIVSIPLIVALGLALFLPASSEGVELPVGRAVLVLSALTLVPIATGMEVRRRFRALALRAEAPFRVVATVVLFGIVAGSLALQFEFFLENLAQAGLAALLLNLGAMGLGLAIAAAVRLPLAQDITLCIEVGIQNSTLAVTVAVTLLGVTAFAVAPSVYAVLMLVTATGFAGLLGRRRSARGGMVGVRQ